MANKNTGNSAIGFIITLILLTGAAGAVFYFGWIQFDLPENTYGVLYSKTSGYDEEVFVPGKFSWRWERVLPTNSELIEVEVKTQSAILEYKGELPSADLYSSTLPNKTDFSINLTVRLSYRIIEERLPSLIEDGMLKNESLPHFYERIETEYLNLIKEGSKDFFIQNLTITNESYKELEGILADKIRSRYSYLDVQSFTVQYISYPDLELYSKTRDLYHQILERKKETEIAMEKWSIESKVNLDTKIEILTRYGELLSKYPILVDYFALDPESQVLDISHLRDFQYAETGE